jgi:2-oxoacid:acceptor oxidoreductase gamma subunit (pyruvate/2-ketoisovalerate family)
MTERYSVAYPVEIRWHGRGGQGAVTAAKLLAEVAVAAGQYVQSFPQFGSERRGAPIQAFTRIDHHQITLYNSVSEPDIVIVLDPSLLQLPPTLAGLRDGGLLLVNAHPDDVADLAKTSSGRYQVACVPASQIALDFLGRPMTNTAMLGAFMGITQMMDLDDVAILVEKNLSENYSAEVADTNVKALRKAYHDVQMIAAPNLEVKG